MRKNACRCEPVADCRRHAAPPRRACAWPMPAGNSPPALRNQAGGGPVAIRMSSGMTQAVTGLSEKEAAVRLEQDGPNELPSSRPRGVTAIALAIVREPMFLLLISA